MLLPLELKAGLLLGVAVMAYWGWSRMVEGYRDEGRQECRDAAVAQYKENVDDLARIAAKARAGSLAGAADADRLRTAADRLRGAVAGSGLVIRSAAAAGSSPASEAELVSAELLRRAEELARFADESHRAGGVCVESYEAVSR